MASYYILFCNSFNFGRIFNNSHTILKIPASGNSVYYQSILVLAGLGPLLPLPTDYGKGILLFIPVPEWLDARQSGIPEFKKHFKKLKRDTYTLHVHTASDGF